MAKSPKVHPVCLRLVDPQPYLEFNYLVRHAKGVITDSGGVTEETTVMGVPCVTLRDTTERPETMSIGTNELIGTDPRRLSRRWIGCSPGSGRRGKFRRSGTGVRGRRIVEALVGLFGS